jgi:hypothetical protein
MRYVIQDPKTALFYGALSVDEVDTCWTARGKVEPFFFEDIFSAKRVIESFSCAPREKLEIRTEDGELAIIYPTYAEEWYKYIV